jgi:hypothetical protein
MLNSLLHCIQLKVQSDEAQLGAEDEEKLMWIQAETTGPYIHEDQSA